MQESVNLYSGMVPSQRRGICFDGGTLYSKVRDYIIQIHSDYIYSEHYKMIDSSINTSQSSWCLLRNNESRSTVCSWLSRQCRTIEWWKILWTKEVVMTKISTNTSINGAGCTIRKMPFFWQQKSLRWMWYDQFLPFLLCMKRKRKLINYHRILFIQKSLLLLTKFEWTTILTVHIWSYQLLNVEKSRWPTTHVLSSLNIKITTFLYSFFSSVLLLSLIGRSVWT